MTTILISILFAISSPVLIVAPNSKPESPLTVRSTENSFYASNTCKTLLTAVKEKDSAKVAELLKTADPNCIYRDGGEPRTALVSAARNGDLVIGKLLIGAGARVDFHAKGDETPLMAAAKNGKLEFVTYLVANGAAINTTLEGEGTALSVASGAGHVETVRYLIAQGAEINQVVAGDGTALINAARNGHHEVAKILLEKGADPNLASPGDEHPMYHARKSNDKAMVALLKKYEKEY